MAANGYVAEREGFEPSVPRKRDNGFRDRPVRPLRHLSAELNSIRAKNKTDRNPMVPPIAARCYPYIARR